MATSGRDCSTLQCQFALSGELPRRTNRGMALDQPKQPRASLTSGATAAKVEEV